VAALSVETFTEGPRVHWRFCNIPEATLEQWAFIDTALRTHEKKRLKQLDPCRAFVFASRGCDKQHPVSCAQFSVRGIPSPSPIKAATPAGRAARRAGFALKTVPKKPLPFLTHRGRRHHNRLPFQRSVYSGHEEIRSARPGSWTEGQGTCRYVAALLCSG
jgi:hypothetical protein